MTNKKDKKPWRKLIKTDRNSYKTFTISDFVLTNKEGKIDDALKETATSELKEMCALMRSNENDYYEKNFRPLIRSLSESGNDTKGKKNAALRAYITDIPYPPKVQSYNFMEMLRYNIASKTDIYITRYKTEILIKENPDATPRDIKQLYNDTFDDCSPSVNEIKKYQAAIRNSGHIDGLPHSNGQLPLSATDGHYRHLSCDDGIIHLMIKLACGEVVLHFNLPKDKKRYEGKVCMPVVRCVNDRLLFDFPVMSARPPKKDVRKVTGFIGVDAGEVTTASYCFVGYDKTISQPFLETKRVRWLEDRISSLFDEIDALQAKAVVCDGGGFFDKAGVLYREAGLRRGVVSRLKCQVNELVACEVVRAAVVLGAGVAVEDLSWVPESHWDQADLRGRLVGLAADHGVPVVMVGAAGTSCTCPYCGGELRDCGGRRKRCVLCGRRVDRDVAGERNVGVRACGFWDCCGFSYRLVGLGSREYRRECGVLARCNKSLPSVVPDDRVSSSVVLKDPGTSSPT